MKKLLVCLFAALLFSGCATGYDVDLSKNHMDTEAKHSISQGQTMSAQAKAIAKLKAIPASNDPRDIALASITNIFLAQEISKIQYHKSGLVAPRLNTDNVAEVGKTIRAGVPIFGMVRVTEVALENTVGETTVQTVEGDIAVSDSLNRTENHATALDGSTSSNASTQESNEVLGVEEEVEEELEVSDDSV